MFFTPQVPEPEVTNVLSVEEDPPLVGVVEPAQ